MTSPCSRHRIPMAAGWDAEQRFRVVRDRDRVLLPTPPLAQRIDALAA